MEEQQKKDPSTLHVLADVSLGVCSWSQLNSSSYKSRGPCVLYRQLVKDSIKVAVERIRGRTRSFLEQVSRAFFCERVKSLRVIIISW
jgi:hypothetical protein